MEPAAMGKELLFEFRSSHYHEAISAAVDMYHLCRQAQSISPLPGNRSTRLAMVAIAQAVTAIEATVNSFGDELLFDERSNSYIAPDLNDVPLSTLRSAWPRSLGVTDKLKFILSRHGAVLSIPVAMRLVELVTYRNWLVHGYVFQSLRLWEFLDDREGILHEHDREDSVDWKARFPQLKFNALDSVTASDAEKALRVMLEVLGDLARASSSRFELLYFSGVRALHTFLTGNQNEIDEIVSAGSPEVNSG